MQPTKPVITRPPLATRGRARQQRWVGRLEYAIQNRVHSAPLISFEILVINSFCFTTHTHFVSTHFLSNVAIFQNLSALLQQSMYVLEKHFFTHVHSVQSYALHGESIYSICPWGYFHQGGQYHIYGAPATDRSGSKNYSGHNQDSLEHPYHGIPVCSNQSLLHTLITVAYNFDDCVLNRFCHQLSFCS